MDKKPFLGLGLILVSAIFFTTGCAENTSKKIHFGNLPTSEEMETSAREFNKEMEGNQRYQHEKAGEKLLKEQKYNEAIKEFDAALKLDPSVQTVHLKKGIALYRNGQPQEGIISIDQSIKLNQRGKVWLWYPLQHKGVALGMLGKSKEAVTALTGSIDANPTADSYFWRALAYGQMNQLDKASQDAQEGLKLRSGDKRLQVLSTQLKHLRSSKIFLDEMAAKKGAQKTKSGLIYFELKAGSGLNPKATDTVQVHYHGTLPDGTVFDSSVDRGQPIGFPLNQVIPCWTEGVQKMKVGGKSRLVCPSHLAYGNRKVGAHIQPGATLLFDVELLSIE